jgi:cytochrome c553
VNIHNRFAASTVGTIALLMISSMASAQKSQDAVPRIVTWNCSGCHGVNGNAQLQHFPRLAGLDASYIEQRIAAFQAAPAPPSDELLFRLFEPAAAKKVNAGSTPEARADMVGIAHAMNPQETKAASAWYSAQKPAAGHFGNPAVIEKGKALFMNGSPAKSVVACQECHGAQAEGQATVPRLGGQNSGYLISQLRRFRAGDRAHPRDMSSSETRFDNEQIRAIAAYLASQ